MLEDESLGSCSSHPAYMSRKDPSPLGVWPRWKGEQVTYISFTLAIFVFSSDLVLLANVIASIEHSPVVLEGSMELHTEPTVWFNLHFYPHSVYELMV